MNVVINALQYKQDSSGIGVMLRELIGAYTSISSRPCQIVLPSDGPDLPAGPSAQVVRAPCSYGQGLRRMGFQSFRMGPRYCRGSILLTTDSKIPFLLPEDCFVIPIVTDLAVYRLPGAYRPSRTVWWRAQYRYVRRRAGLFLAVSSFTKRELTDVLHVPPEKIEVVPCACSPRFRPVRDGQLLAELRRKYRLPDRFVLFVGNLNPRKNLRRLVQAFDLAKQRIPHQLVVAGGQGWRLRQEDVLGGIAHREDVRFIGYVPDEEMPALYSAAELFAFPSLYEGFGIPVLEAQSCGTPVLTSACSALPEVGGDAAVYVDPMDVEAIRAGMLRILEDPGTARRLAQQGPANAGRSCWLDSARRLDRIIEAVAEGRWL